MTPGAKTIPGKPAPRAGALLVAQLPLGSSRAAELEARTTEGGDEEILVELVVGPSIGQFNSHRKPIAEPWARKECVKWEIGQFPSPALRARSLPMRRRGRRRLCRVRREMPRSIILVAGVVASPPPPVLRSLGVRSGVRSTHSRSNRQSKGS